MTTGDSTIAERQPGSKRKTGYLPSLDGWRAVAILGVLMIHDLPWRIGSWNNLGFIRYGSYGVILFFSISGLLITTRILEEEELVGTFHLRSFYIRRLFRIQPAAFVYLGTIALLVLAGIVHEHWNYWRGALFLYANFLYRPTAFNNQYSYFTGHFWTLAVEEHYYLLISLLLFFLRRRRIAILIALIFTIKLGHGIARHYIPDPLLRRTYWQVQVLLIPSVAALIVRLPRLRAAAVRWMQAGPILALFVLMFLLIHGVLLPGVIRGHLAATETFFITYSCTALVIATMLHPASLVTRMLETAPIRFLGRLSYSIYLWHVLFFFQDESLTNITFPPLVFLSHRPWKYLATLAAALASYYLIEKPLIRFGHRLAPSATAGRLDLNDLPTERPVQSTSEVLHQRVEVKRSRRSP